MGTDTATLIMINTNGEDSEITITASEVSYVRGINNHKSEVIMNSGERYLVRGSAKEVFSEIIHDY